MITTWQEFLESESKKEYYKETLSLLEKERKTFTVYPSQEDIFNAFTLTTLNEVKVCIFGQDPYHGPNQAHGLSFSVKPECQTPPSLKNIFKEIKSDLNLDCKSPCLVPWATQGVLLLNSILSVREGQPGSHKDIGWQEFTNNAIKLLNEQDTHIVYMLWGAYARTKKELITNSKHLVLESSHPSPLSCKLFYGNKHFSKANDYLNQNFRLGINWET